MGDGVHHGDIGAGAQLQVVARLDVRRAHEVDAPRVDDDELGALAKTALHARGEHRVAVGRVRTDDHDDIGLRDRVEILGARRGAERLLEAVAGRRMTDACAGVDVVVAEHRTHHLLDEEGLLVGAARGGHRADRVLAVLRLQAAELGGDASDGLVPGGLAPRVGDPLADERRQHAVRVGGIAPGEASLDAGVAAIGLAVVVRHHAHDLVAADLRLEGAADAAVGAGGEHRALGLADLDDALLDERRRRAGLHAGAAGDALGVDELLVDAGRDLGLEAATGDGQRERALHLVAGAHAARTDDALGRVEGEVRVGLVLLGVEVVGAVVAVAHLAQAHRARHVLQLAVTVGRTGQAVERMVGDVELHHAAPERLELAGLGVDLHALGDRRGAGCRRAVAALDLDEAEPAGTEGLERIGGAELGDRYAGLSRGAHDRSARRHLHGHAVDLYRHALGGTRRRRTEVTIVDDGAHGRRKSCGK